MEAHAETEAFRRLGALVSHFDTGAKTCVLSKLSEIYKGSIDDESVDERGPVHFPIDILKLEYNSEINSLVDEVLRLRYHLNRVLRCPEMSKRLTTLAISEHIFHTNQIEFCGTDTLEDTLDIIEHSKNPSTEEDHLVVSMWRLMRCTHIPDASVDDCIFSPVGLREWRGMLTSSPRATYRKVGCVTEATTAAAHHESYTPHVYPHHTIVAPMIRTCSFYCTYKSFAELTSVDKSI